MGENIKKLLLLVFLLPAPMTSLQAAGILRVSPTNPRYFTDDSGKAIYMTGSHTWFMIQGNTANRQSDISYQHMENYLNWVASYDHNFQRVWANFSYCNIDGPFPWNRPGPGTALCGGPKFDMSSFNQSYFDTLRERVLQVTNRGMYASIMLFGSGVAMKTGWDQIAWNPANNINTELAVFGTAKTSENSFYTSNSSALALQQALARKMIDTLNDIDNLILEVINEGQLPEGEVWQNNMIDYISSYEKTKPKQHLVLMSGCGCDPGRVLFNSKADCISPDGAGSYTFQEGGDANYTAKIIINDTDHVGGYSVPGEAEIYRKWVWKAFARGTHPLFMDSYNAYVAVDGVVLNNGTIMPIFDPVRKAMGRTKIYADRMVLNSTIPSTTLCSTRYCLINAGNEYFFYQPNTGQFTATIVAGDYNYEWYNPVSGVVVATGTVTATGASQGFTPPFSGDAVLFLKKAPSPTSNSPAAPSGLVVQ